MTSITNLKKYKWKINKEVPMLDAILAGEKLWNSGAPAQIQKSAIRKVAKRIAAEHEYMLDHEPQDEFHACVLLGALNVLNGLLSNKKPINLEERNGFPGGNGRKSTEDDH